MATRVEAFDEKILACAREEFLVKGYVDASLRTIAQNAGVSTSTIYTRYTDKEGLFRFLVTPATDGFKTLLAQILGAFTALPREEQSESYQAYSDQGFESIIAFIYDHFAAFKMLVNNAPGHCYQDFLESVVQLDTDCTKQFLVQVGSAALADGRLTDGFLHVVSSAFYAGVFEVVIHDMPLEEAKSYIQELRLFYSNGWKAYY